MSYGYNSASLHEQDLLPEGWEPDGMDTESMLGDTARMMWIHSMNKRKNENLKEEKSSTTLKFKKEQ